MLGDPLEDRIDEIAFRFDHDGRSSGGDVGERQVGEQVRLARACRAEHVEVLQRILRSQH